MYRIYCDDEIIYDPRVPEYPLLEGSLQLELNTSGNLSFTIPKENPAYGRIKLMKSNITLYDDDRLLFFGRAYAPSVDLFQRGQIECEGIMAFFNDTYIAPFDYPLGTVEGLLRKVIDEHNKQMPTNRQVRIGKVTVQNDTDSGQIVRSSIAYLSTWQVIKEKFLDLLGGYLVFRYETDGVYLDYLKVPDFEGKQEVKQAVNVLDARKESSSHELATAILPLGAKVKSESGDDTDERVMISSINQKLPYIVDPNGVAEYGMILKITYHDDITQPENLLRAAKKDLANALGVQTKISITAADLSKAGVEVDTFLLGSSIPVEIPNLGINERMLVSALSIDLLNPASSHLTIGKEEMTFTLQQQSSKETIHKMSNNLQAEIKEKTDRAIVRAIREANSTIQQSSEEIRSEVSEKYYNKEKTDELLESTNTLVKQTANNIEYQFNTYKKEQNQLFGNNASRFTEISKYIRFENGNIILGEQGNPIVLRIENDRIVFLESGVESAYWHNRKFYAVDAEFLTSLKLGKFAFMPRATGNLSFTKVVD